MLRPKPTPKKLMDDRSAGLYAPGQHQWYLIRHGPQVIACAQSFPRAIRINQLLLNILGLAAVCTRPEYRRQGLAAAVVNAALDRVRNGSLPFCLFQTSHKNRPFYERLGCCLVANPIINSLSADPTANPFWDEIAMRFPNTAAWPLGPVDLLGPGY